MRTSAPPLLPIFRSQLQGQLLAAVLLSREESSISDLAVRLEAPVATVQREVARLEGAGIIATRRVGHTRLVSPDRRSPLNEPLTELVLRSFGPVVVLARELETVDRVDRVEISVRGRRVTTGRRAHRPVTSTHWWSASPIGTMCMMRPGVPNSS